MSDGAFDSQLFFMKRKLVLLWSEDHEQPIDEEIRIKLDGQIGRDGGDKRDWWTDNAL